MKGKNKSFSWGSQHSNQRIILQFKGEKTVKVNKFLEQAKTTELNQINTDRTEKYLKWMEWGGYEYSILEAEHKFEFNSYYELLLLKPT